MGSNDGSLKLKRMIRNPKLELLAVLALLAGYAFFTQYDSPAIFLNLIIAIAAALFSQWALLGKAKAASLQSAAVTGAIAGMLAAPSADARFLWLAPFLAIAAKRIFRFSASAHIFNPAAIGLVLATVILGNQINWWGFSSPYIVIACAGIILFRMNRLSLPFAYVLGRGLSVLVAGHGAEGISAFALPNLFFAFVMLVEPKTSPVRRPAQWGFGLLCGILATVCFKLIPRLDGDLLALMTVNLLRPLIGRGAVWFAKQSSS